MRVEYLMIAYCDGSCRKNFTEGGFGIVLVDDDDNIIGMYDKQFNYNITNNEMELKSILYVLINYGYLNDKLIIYSDSSYAVNTLMTWMYSWERNGWIKGDGAIPKNLDIIQACHNILIKYKDIRIKHVKGHQGNKYNEIADQLATGKFKK